MPRRPKLGDVVEIKTRLGFAYAQYTHKHPQYGALLRVLPGTHETRPEYFGDLVGRDPTFMIFFPLGAAIHRGIFEIAARETISPQAAIFPTFRSGMPDPATGRVKTWWLWDGEKEWRIGDLTSEQRKLSLRGVCNDTFLIELIESGWTPETDIR